MKKVLLIEDNQDVRENTAEILELAGYDVATAENGKIGVELAQNDIPDIIICDIMMPVLDGYGVIHILNKQEETANIPFIFLTAKTERGDFRKGMNLGADDYLTKPFDDSELLDAIEGRLKKNDLLRKQYDSSASGLDKFFQEAKDIKDLADIAESGKSRFFKKKSNLYYEGDLPLSLILIQSGKVKTYKSNEEGKELITGIHGPGDFLGYNDLINGGQYLESAESLEDTEVYTVGKDDFYKLIYSNKDVAAKFITILANSLRDKEEQLLHMAYNSVRQRVAEALLQLDRKDEESSGKPISISREDLANIVGTAQESVIRTLSDFRSEGLIEVEKRAMTIKDAEKMNRLVEKGY